MQDLVQYSTITGISVFAMSRMSVAFVPNVIVVGVETARRLNFRFLGANVDHNMVRKCEF